MLQIVLPVLYYIPGDQNHHSYENSLDALLMIKNNAKLLVMSGMFTRCLENSPFKNRSLILLRSR